MYFSGRYLRRRSRLRRKKKYIGSESIRSYRQNRLNAAQYEALNAGRICNAWLSRMACGLCRNNKRRTSPGSLERRAARPHYKRPRPRPYKRTRSPCGLFSCTYLYSILSGYAPDRKRLSRSARYTYKPRKRHKLHGCRK